MAEPNERGEERGEVLTILLAPTGVLSMEVTMRVLVVLYHVGDALARTMERAGVSGVDVELWCSDWEDAVTGCSSRKGLGWLQYADSLARLITRYHALVIVHEMADVQTK